MHWKWRNNNGNKNSKNNYSNSNKENNHNNNDIMRKGKTFRKLCFIGTQKTHNVNIKTKCKRKKIEKNKLWNNGCCRCISLEKKGGLYNTNHELLSEK